MKTTTETMSHRTAGEPPPCLQCCHGQYSSATPHHAMTWPPDHDDNHARTCSTRRCSLQAKLARPSLTLMTLWSGEPIALYVPQPRTIYKGSQGTHDTHPLPFHSFSIVAGLLELLFRQSISQLQLFFLFHHSCTHIVKTSEHSSDEHALDHLRDWTQGSGLNQYKSSCLLNAIIVFLEQRGNRISLLIQFTKHRQ